MAVTRNNQQNTRTTANATSATLASYTPTSGTDSVLVVRASALRTSETTFTLSCAFGATGMTQAVTAETSSTSRWYRTSIFYLVNPGTSAADIVVTASTTMGGFIIDAVTLLGAAQSSVVGITDTDAVTNSTADTTYTLNSTTANSLIVAAVMSTSAGAPTWSWSTATEDYDLAGSSDTAELAGSGGYYATSGGNVTLTATRSATVVAQVGCAAEFKMAAGANQTLTGATIASGATVNAPSMVTMKLAGAAIAGGTTLNAPAKISFTLTAPTISAGSTVYAPSSVSIAGAGTTLTGAHIASTAAVNAPAKVNLILTAPAIASTAALAAPMVYRGTIRIDNVTTYAQGDVSSASFQHTTPAGDNRLLLVVATYYDTAGVASLTFGSGGSGDGQFNAAWGVAVAPDGSVYVADVNNSRIQKFTAAGVFATKWGSSGAGDGEFSFASGVAVAPDGSVYVADASNDRIQKFTAAGVFVTKWGSNGTGNGQFDTPFGVAVAPDGSVYVADSWNDRIQKFDADGVFVTKWGSLGTADGQFDNPTGVAVAPDGSVYVVDYSNNRIQKFDEDGVFIAKWGSSGTGNGQFATPFGMATAPDGSVYVADRANNRIQKFDADGVFVTKWGSLGTGDGQFISPYGVAVASDGIVYALDTSNNRVQVFAADLHLNAALYNGVEMDVAAGVDAGSYFQNFYVMPSPPVGTYEIALVSPTEPNAFIITAISFSGVEITNTDYTGADAGRAEQETSTTALQIAHNRTYPTNSLSLFALLYETAGTTLTAAADNFVWFSQVVGTLTNTLGFRPTPTRTTGSQTYGATASPAVTQKITAVLHLESVRGALTVPAWSSSATLYAPARVALEGQELDGATIASGSTLYAPSMVGRYVTAPVVASTAAVNAPARVNHRLGGATIAATALNAPTVTTGAVTLAPPLIDGTTLAAPTVTTGAVALAGAVIALSPTVYAPAAIVPGGVTLTGRPVDIGTQVYAPTVRAVTTLVAPVIADTVVHAPSATVRYYLILPFIGCETPMAINSPEMINLATLYAMTMLALRLSGVGGIAGTTVYAPAAVTQGPRVQTGDVFPPVEVDTN